MRIPFAVLALAALAVPASAEQYTLDLKPENTKIEWTLTDVLHTVHGVFAFKSGKIDFDTSAGSASGQVVVDVTSGNSGSEARDRRMHAHVLESAKYPEAVFTPGRVEGTLAVPGVSNVKLHGMLTIHGASHEITMDVQSKADGDRMNAAMTFEIPYVSWGMKDPSNFILKVSKTVQVSIQSAGTLTKR